MNGKGELGAVYRSDICRRVILLIIDSLGVGAMPDIEDRPLDAGSNTLRSIYSTVGFSLPNLESLGLKYFLGEEGPVINSVGVSGLKYLGADSFYGHQELFGNRFVKPSGKLLKDFLPDIKKVLNENKVIFEEVKKDGNVVLKIEGAFTLGNNIETDPGQAMNITADLTKMDFNDVVEIGKLIREVIDTPRLIVFGSQEASIEKIVGSIEVLDNGLCGVNSPKSGVYTNTYECVHLGCKIDYTKQVPYVLEGQKIATTLIGKVADICHSNGKKLSLVDTEETMKLLLENMDVQKDGLIAVNIQETDLAGHALDLEKYQSKLKIVDGFLKEVLDNLKDDDLLIVTADHGNDPLGKHANHTREFVPIMVKCKGDKVVTLEARDSLADIGATIVDYLGDVQLENGKSFLGEFYEGSK